jgi:uridine kinase
MTILVGIAGGSGSGKTTFARKLNEHFADHSNILYQDNYYKDQSDQFDYDGGSVNFDHPDSIDFDLMIAHLNNLKNKESISLPYYDFATHKRLDKTTQYNARKIIFIDGILIFTQKEIINLLDYKLFTDCDEETRFERRLKRDIEERGRTKEGVIQQFQAQVKPMHDQFVEPSKKFACDIVQVDTFEQKLKEWQNKLAKLI